MGVLKRRLGRIEAVTGVLVVPKVVPNADLRDSNYLQVVDYKEFFW